VPPSSLPRPPVSATQSYATLAGSVRHFWRRFQISRILAGLLLAVVVLATLRSNQHKSDQVQAQWGQAQAVWITTKAIAAGSVITTDALEQTDAPVRFVPDGYAVNDPTGHRVHTNLHRGEIVISSRIASDRLSGTTARTPIGWTTIALDHTSELFSVGDRVDLHHLVDGSLLATNAVVVDVGESDLAVAVEPASVAAVVTALGQAGVVPVLRG
jgi:hypothetical protein